MSRPTNRRNQPTTCGAGHQERWGREQFAYHNIEQQPMDVLGKLQHSTHTSHDDVACVVVFRKNLVLRETAYDLHNTYRAPNVLQLSCLLAGHVLWCIVSAVNHKTTQHMKRCTGNERVTVRCQIAKHHRAGSMHIVPA